MSVGRRPLPLLKIILPSVRSWSLGSPAFLSQTHKCAFQFHFLKSQFLTFQPLSFTFHSDQFSLLPFDLLSFHTQFFLFPFETVSLAALSPFNFTLTSGFFVPASSFFPQESLLFPQSLSFTFLLKQKKYYKAIIKSFVGLSHPNFIKCQDISFMTASGI